jgi:signal transduction histidine kinase
MGGTLELVTTPQQGSTFRVELPLANDLVEVAERRLPG